MTMHRRRRGTESGGDTPPATPRWVKLFAIVALSLVLLFVVSHLAGGGLGRHAAPGDASRQLAAPGVADAA